MKKKNFESAIACIGAVIGAGFASGREIVTFFSRYGVHSWWLILISALTMVFLCAITMREASRCCDGNWCEIYKDGSKVIRHGSQICAILLMAITGGAMVSASGHMVELLWPFEWAYSIGALATLGVAWWLGFGSTKPLSIISGVLTVLFIGAILIVLAQNTDGQMVVTTPIQSNFSNLFSGTINAIAYASMNLTIAIGVVCKCAKTSKRSICRLSTVFGFMLVGMLFVSNYLYLKHPELDNEAFPIVKLLSQFGVNGFVASVLLLYLAIFTTLVAVICTLRNAVESYTTTPTIANYITILLPLLVSFVGFTEIVGQLYAPVGFICLLFVFLPLIVKRARKIM